MWVGPKLIIPNKEYVSLEMGSRMLELVLASKNCLVGHSRASAPQGKLSLCRRNLETDGNQIDGIILYDCPSHLQTLQHAHHGFFVSVYLVLLTPSPSPFYAGVLALDPSYHDARVREHLTLIDTFGTILPLD